MSEHDVVINLTGVVVLGIGAQWIAWRLRLPSILLLLVFGLLAGPGAEAILGHKLLDPDQVLSELLLPLTSFAVGLILFEGGMTLRLREMSQVGGALTRLVTLGALTTWLLASGLAYALGLVEGPVALVLGAILVVTGPTVVGPLLRHIRPTGAAGALLKWEGIVIDPIGATLALLVFEAIIVGNLETGLVQGLLGFAKTGLVGGVMGVLAGLVIVIPYRKHWIPDHLEAPIAFMVVIGSFTASNLIQEEAGLLTTTVMGLVIGNVLLEQAKPILQFKENLQVLLISTLFIVLAARLTPENLTSALSWQALVLLVGLVLVIRPASVLLSTLGSPLPLKERLLLCWMAPRGIVAAAVASVFGLRLTEHGQAGGEELASLTFVVIIGTVALYGLTGAWVARRLGLAESNPQGLVILGADEVAKAIAAGVEARGVRTQLVDTSRSNVRAARMDGLPVVQANVLSPHGFAELDLGGMGRFLAMTPNDEVNTLAAERFLEVFGRVNVFQLAPTNSGRPKQEAEAHERARPLFGVGIDHASLRAALRSGGSIKGTRLSDEFSFEDWRELHGESAVPLFLLRPDGSLVVWSPDGAPLPVAGDLLIAVVQASASAESARLPKGPPNAD